MSERNRLQEILEDPEACLGLVVVIVGILLGTSVSLFILAHAFKVITS